MSQLYVPDRNWVLCTEGIKKSEIKVSSQTSVKICDGRKLATEEDRFDTDFDCQKLKNIFVNIGEAFGAVRGIMIGAAIGSIGGPVASFFAGVAGGAYGYFLGKAAGASVPLLPGTCTFMCMLSQWSEVHPKVKAEGKKALLEKAKINCIVGGLVYLKLWDKVIVTDMSAIADNVSKPFDEVLAKGDNASIPDGYERLSSDELTEMGFSPTDVDDNDGSGFYSQVYKDNEGNYVLAFRGSEDLGKDYIGTNRPQATGDGSEQHDKAIYLAQKLKEIADAEGKDMKITGHSLGGGLAATASAATGCPTYTFNAAGVHDNTLEMHGLSRDNMDVEAYNDSNDILNAQIQDNRELIIGGMGALGPLGIIARHPFLMILGLAATSLALYLEFVGGIPQAAGERIELDTKNKDTGILGSVEAHGLDGLIEALRNTPNPNTTVFCKNK